MLKNKKINKTKLNTVLITPTPQVVQTIQTPPQTPNSGLESGPIPIIPKELMQQLNAQIHAKLKQTELDKKKQEKTLQDFKILESLTSEYLKSFLIIGYTLDGHKILIGHAPTPQEHDALVEHLRQTFIRTVNEM